MENGRDFRTSGAGGDGASTRPTVLTAPAWPGAARGVGWGAALLAVGILVAMGATRPTGLNRPKAVPVEQIAERMEMRTPAIFGRLVDGRVYTVKAASARMPPGDDRVLDLSDVQGDLQLADGGRIDLIAMSGRFDRRAERLTLAGGVTLTRSDGYRVQTETAEVWRTADGVAASSDSPTRLTGPEGSAVGEGMTASPGMNVVRLTGRVRVRLNEETTQ